MIKMGTLAITGCVAIIGIGIFLWEGSDTPAPEGGSINVPEFTPEQAKGEEIFNANCEGCHGTYAAGSKIGPTLIHKIYEPSHHADGAFYLAAKNGVRQHHWQLGSMPPIANVSDAQVGLIIQYVRAIQRANGVL